MDTVNTVLTYVANNYDVIAAIILGILGAAAGVAKLTKNKTDDAIVDGVSKAAKVVLGWIKNRNKPQPPVGPAAA